MKLSGKIMSKIIEDIKHSVDSTIPEVEDLSHMVHPKIDLIIRLLYHQPIFPNLLPKNKNFQKQYFCLQNVTARCETLGFMI